MVAHLLPLAVRGAEVNRQGHRLLGPIDLDITPQGILVIIGPNGSGKTTMLRMLHGLDPLESGSLTWAVDENQARLRQSFVFQSPIMLRRTVLSNLTYPLMLRGEGSRRAKVRATAFAGRFQLEQFLPMSAGSLSGGEQQKLALARALISKPDIIFLDEPCANLDGRATREIESLLQETNSSGTKIVLSTHDLGQARRLADQVVFLLNGCVHEIADSATFFAEPKSRAATQFLAGDIIT
ncbi:MAG: ATP-binding cassette domain-containing protein [Rhodobacteraceae bacterium]|nr:ATP-binding cassette domain-containing protein [Paracoccaceae bacterium]